MIKDYLIRQNKTHIYLESPTVTYNINLKLIIHIQLQSQRK